MYCYCDFQNYELKNFTYSSIIFALSNLEENVTHAIAELVLTRTILQILD